jgi:hypothetical protein
MVDRLRGERLQIMLSPEELTLIDDFRFAKRMPSRAATVRELPASRPLFDSDATYPLSNNGLEAGTSALIAPRNA